MKSSTSCTSVTIPPSSPPFLCLRVERNIDLTAMTDNLCKACLERERNGGKQKQVEKTKRNVQLRYSLFEKWEGRCERGREGWEKIRCRWINGRHLTLLRPWLRLVDGSDRNNQSARMEGPRTGWACWKPGLGIAGKSEIDRGWDEENGNQNGNHQKLIYCFAPCSFS